MNFSAATQKAIEDSAAVVRVGYPWWMRPFLMKGVVAITLARWIFLSAEMEKRSEDYIDRLLRHELAHVRQVNQIGFMMFLIRYGLEFVMHLWHERNVDRAYRRISFEVEAWGAEEGEAQSGL